MARGCLIIADITGYTAYLSESELEHAHQTLTAILDLIVEQTKAPLVVSRLEGDAVISYAVEGTFVRGQTIVEIIEMTYVEFRRALDLMVLNTTCECNACRNIPSLDLKFIVHDGEFMMHALKNQTELVGSDVNLAHRLAKNSIPAETGIKAYAAYTEAAVAALGLEAFFAGLPRHTEHYEHFGTVHVRVQDLAPVWERERDTERQVVTPEDAVLSVSIDLPVGRIEAWDYVTDPGFRAILFASSTSDVDLGERGRMGEGSVYQCVHGKTDIPNLVVDWQPFEQYTFDGRRIFASVHSLMTLRLEPLEDGTRLVCSLGRGRGPLLLRVLDDVMMRVLAPADMRKQGRKLVAAIEEDLERRGAAAPART